MEGSKAMDQADKQELYNSEITPLDDLLAGFYDQTAKDNVLADDAPETLPEEIASKSKQKRSTCLKRTDRNIYRRAFSETQLLDILGFNFQDGESYHVITGGDVDSLSYLKVILRQQDLDYCLFSTWCMASEDIYQIEEWLEEGRIKKMDAYVGEIFPGTYRLEYKKLVPVIKRFGGRVAVFRNHAKIYAGYGPKFHFGVESSANINTNPGTENACVTIGEEIYQFYKDYFDGIVSFENDDQRPSRKKQ